MTDLAELVYDVPVLGPVAIGITGLNTVSQPVLGSDPVRRGVIFHNPGSNAIRVAPSNLVLAGGAGGILIYPYSEFTLYADDLFHATCAWIGVGDTDDANPLTIFNFTDATSVVPPPEALMRVNVYVPITSPVGAQTLALSTGSQQILGANPNRRGVIFQNCGPVPVGVCPANLLASASAGSMLILPGAEKRIVAKGRVRVNCAWNAAAQSGTGALTVLDFV